MREQKIDAHGRPATGIPPIQCPDWCTNPGHVAEHDHADQVCYGKSVPVICSLGHVEVSEGEACHSVVEAWACRRFNEYPVVNLYVYGFRPFADISISLTAAEARQIATSLGVAADLIGGSGSTGLADLHIVEYDLPPVPTPAGDTEVSQIDVHTTVRIGEITAEVVRFVYWNHRDGKPLEVTWEVQGNGLPDGGGVADFTSETPELLADLAAVSTKAAEILRRVQDTTP